MEDECGGKPLLKKVSLPGVNCTYDFIQIHTAFFEKAVRAKEELLRLSSAL
jgi:hypothetical protein